MGNRKKPKAPWLRKKRTEVPEMGRVIIDLKPEDKVVIKEVPAKVDGVVVGTAQIYEDGTLGVIINDDCPPELREKIDTTATQMGYSIGTDEI